MISTIILNAFPDKRIKSLGNKCLLKVSKNKNLINHHIDIFKDVSSQIVLVCGFEYKKLKKYIDDNLCDTVSYVHHNIDDKVNIGKSILTLLSQVDISNGLLFINSNLIINKSLIKKLDFNSSFIIKSKQNDNDIGCIVDQSSGTVINCYYGLQNKLYDILYISKNDLSTFKDITKYKNFHKMYLFEIINLCIDNKISIRYIDVKTSTINTIDSIQYTKQYENNNCIL